jgi:hypothetical protein
LDLIPKCESFVTPIFLITPFIINSSQLFEENSDIKLIKVFNKLKNVKNSKVSHKELKKLKQEKRSLIMQLSESHVLIDSLKSKNTMLFNTDVVFCLLKYINNKITTRNSTNPYRIGLC